MVNLQEYYSRQNTWVRLIPQDHYDSGEIAKKIRAALETEKVDVRDKTVFLKVSFVFPVEDFERTKMINTNPLLIAGVAQSLIELGAAKVFIGDGENIYPARYEFAMVKLQKAIKQVPKALRKKIEFVYLDEVYKEWTTPENAVIPGIKLDYPKLVKDVDIFISMPKLKVNVFANITLSVKNGMGLIKTSTRWKYHNAQLHGMIADIYQIRPPDFVITDAVYAGEGQGPMQATAYQTGLLIFGNNGLAVDAVSCYLMGYKPDEINHLKFLQERGFGTLDQDHIRIETPTIFQEHQHSFVRPEVKMDKVAPNIHYFLGEACESGCPAFMRGMMDGFGLNKGWENLGELYIIMGKNAPVPPEILKKLPKRRTLVYGTCAKAYKKYGKYYSGCPPNYMLAMMTYGLKTDLGMIPWIKFVGYGTFMKTEILHVLAKLRGKKYKNLK